MKKSEIKKLRKKIEINQYPPQFENINSSNVNCYGYALGIDLWIELGRIYGYSLDFNNINPIMAECALYKDAKKLKLKLSKVSKNNLPIPKKNQWLISLYFRTDDFHFIRQDSSGEWSHKPGEDSSEKLAFKIPPDVIEVDHKYLATFLVEKPEVVDVF